MNGIIIGIGIFLGASNYRPAPTPSVDWILYDGTWHDDKHWNDTQNWKDN